MSGAPRKAHEDGNPSSSSSSYSSLDDNGSNPSSLPFEMGQNSRVESRDGDRKSLPHSVHRESSTTVRDSLGGIPWKSPLSIVSLENRAKSWGSKENLEHKVEKRDAVAEARELYHQSSKGEGGRRIETKEVEQERDTSNDSKSGMKMGKDALLSHSKWKELHRVNRQPYAPSGCGVSEPEPDLERERVDASEAVEGIQGRPKLSLIIYRVGKRMQELIRLWKEYESALADKNIKDSAGGPTLDVLIFSEDFTTSNPRVKDAALWGTDIYTYDSDLVAVLMHMGYCRQRASPPSSATEVLRATVRVLPPQDSYISTLRNNVKSCARGAAVDCSYSIERCCIVKEGGGTVDLEPDLTETSTVGPTMAPVAAKHTMTIRAAVSSALEHQRFPRDDTIQYNICNEPWSEYSMSVVADKGLEKTQYTSSRLKKGEVLYLETHSSRYELCFAGEKMVKLPMAQYPNTHSINDERSTKTENTLMDVFRFSKCKRRLPQNVMRSIGIPLPPDDVEVIADNLDWEDVQWSQTGVWIAGKEYELVRVHFFSPN